MFPYRSKRTGMVTFEEPFDAKCVFDDSGLSADCKVIRISETGAELELAQHAANRKTFLLVFTPPPRAVVRRCKRTWIKGWRIGVVFRREQASFHNHMEADR
jgi:hypothetical protein